VQKFAQKYVVLDKPAWRASGSAFVWETSVWLLELDMLGGKAENELSTLDDRLTQVCVIEND
jgi:hypothetical protein